MRRRAFITLLGGAAALPLATRAQQPAMPVIGLLSSLTTSDRQRILTPFNGGLDEVGYADRRNVAIEYRFAEGDYDQLPPLAADLVHRQVSVIAAISGTPAALAAKAATPSIPIIFAIGSDPVPFGLVASLNRPGANVTGVTFFTASLGAKRVGLLRELVPKAITVVLLVNPDNPPSEADGLDAQAAAQTIGLQAKRYDVHNDREIESAFALLANARPDILYIGPDPLFFNSRDKVVALAARHALPAIYTDRETVEASGLIAYGKFAPSKDCRNRVTRGQQHELIAPRE